MHDLRDALEITGATDPGRLRAHNEDALSYDARLGLVVLADGMGGYNAGEVASGVAVDVFAETLQTELEAMAPHLQSDRTLQPIANEMLEVAIERANAMVYELACREPEYSGMGTTLVCALFYDNRLVAGHVGDSRLYRLRGAEFLQLSRDHSLLQEQLDAGLIQPEEARYVLHRNLVTRAIGVGANVEAEIQEFLAEPGDIYLFCSDGLTEMVEDQLIGEILSMFSDNLPLAAQALVDQANASGGRDNISVVLVGIKRSYAVPTGWVSRLKAKFR